MNEAGVIKEKELQTVIVKKKSKHANRVYFSYFRDDHRKRITNCVMAKKSMHVSANCKMIKGKQERNRQSNGR